MRVRALLRSPRSRVLGRGGVYVCRCDFLVWFGIEVVSVWKVVDVCEGVGDDGKCM